MTDDVRLFIDIDDTYITEINHEEADRFLQDPEGFRKTLFSLRPRWKLDKSAPSFVIRR